jgi:ribosomal protein S18 acetylase RimI-like enzyme
VVRLEQADQGLFRDLDGLHREFFEGSSVSPEQFMDFVKVRLEDERMLLILGMEGVTPLGYGLAFDVVEHPFMPEWQRSGYVTQLYVLPEHRDQGIGKLLVDSMLSWMTARGITRVQLNVLVGEGGAEGYWRRFGFEPVRTRMQCVL